MNRRCLTLLIAAIFLSGASPALAAPKIPQQGLPARITVLVKDDEGNPVQGANVRGDFVFLKEKDTKVCRASTDKNGVAELSSHVLVKVRLTVEKPGYYASRDEFVFLTRDVERWEESTAAGKWLPWNPVITIGFVKRRRTSMTATDRREISVPEIGRPCGLDLRRGMAFCLDSVVQTGYPRTSFYRWKKELPRPRTSWKNTKSASTRQTQTTKSPD